MKNYKIILVFVILFICIGLGLFKFLSIQKIAREKKEELTIRAKNLQILKDLEIEREEAKQNYKDLCDKVSKQKGSHYILTYSDGTILEEIFDEVSYQLISANQEIYSNENWFVEIDKKNKIYIAQEKLNPDDYLLPNALYPDKVIPFLKRFFHPKSNGYLKQINEREYILNERDKILVNTEGLPIKIIMPEYVMEIDTFFSTSIRVDMPIPPTDYFARILHINDYRIGDRGIEAMDMNEHPKEPYVRNEERIAYNYEGIINGKEGSFYIQGKNNTNQGSAKIFYKNGLYETYTDVCLSKSMSGCELIIKDKNKQIVFDGIITEEDLKGDWKGKSIQLYPPLLSSKIEFYSLYNLFDMIACWDAKSPTGLINLEIIEYHEKLLPMYIMPEDEWENEWKDSWGERTCGYIYIHCNEQGILCIELENVVSPEEDYLRSAWTNKIAIFDLISGKELQITDILVPEYVNIVREAGYNIRDDHKFIVLPNGIEWQEIFNHWGATDFESLFLDWEKLQPIIKPSGPLSPFLVKSKKSREE